MTRNELLAVLADHLDALPRRGPLRIGIDGVDAAGKTRLADEVGAELLGRGRNVIRASMDGFHNQRAVRVRRGHESPEGYYLDSFDCGALASCLLVPLGPAGSRRIRRAVFDFRTDSPVEAPTEVAAEDAILLFEGVFLARPELRGLWDYRIFVSASFDTTVRRAMERDQYLFGGAEEVRRRYLARYIPGQRLYLAECRPEETADAVVENDDPLMPALRLVR